MTGTVFDQKSISSICGRYKAKDRDELLNQTEAELNARMSEINALIAATGFNGKNISAMLNCVGARAGEGIAALTDPGTIAAFKKLIGSKDKPGVFTVASISSMLSGAGAKVAEGIAALADHLPAGNADNLGGGEFPFLAKPVDRLGTVG